LKIEINLLFDMLFSERMQRKPGDFEDPSIIHVTVGTAQVAVWLKHRLMQIDHPLRLTTTMNTWNPKIPGTKTTRYKKQ